jgi:hypothetical protein
MTAMSGNEGASTQPELYSVRSVGAFPSLGPPEFRSSEAEPFRQATEHGGRFYVPASNVDGHSLRVQVHYRTLSGLPRTAWLRRDVRPALSGARTLYLFEGQHWTEVKEDASGVRLVINEKPDDVSRVFVSLDGAPEIEIARGVESLPLPRRPAKYRTRIQTIDGKSARQHLVAEGDGYAFDWSGW